MRILYVRNLYLPADFGGNRYPWEVTERLTRRGHEVVVITGSPSKRIHPPGVRLVTYRASRRTPLHTFVTNAYGARQATRALLHSWRPDVVIHSSPETAYGYYRSTERRTRPASIYIYHSRFVSDAVDRLSRRVWPLSTVGHLTRRVMDRVEMVDYTSPDAIIAVSPFSKTELEERLGGPDPRIEVIPTGVDTNAFRPGDRAAARRELGIPDEARVIMTVGRLVPVKRYDRAIDALAMLRRSESGTDYRLVVVGRGPERGSLGERVRAAGLDDAVRFDGFRKGDELRTRYAAADLVLCTSEFENWSLSLLEALACGVPVLGVPNGGIPQLLATVDEGLILADSEPTTAAAAIRSLLADRARLAALGAMARRVAVSQYDWDVVVARLEASFRRLLLSR
jgi:glycosyltransferase involved in cell wall biosynthesis